LKKLLNHFFKKSDSWPDFQEAPAAKGIHHAYIGGLLEHSLSVARVADFLAKHYEGVDRSLLIAGALLHDIGKLEELKMEGGLVEYTVRGRLKGHLVIGSEMVALAAGEIRDFPEELLEQLQHLVLSHHGRQEFGSPAVPMTVEAFILSFLDDLDAKMNITEQLRRKMDNKELSWTDYQRSLERYLYLGGFERKEPEGSVTQPNSSRQPSLF
jgi:3'-5' exoribonuclease